MAFLGGKPTERPDLLKRSTTTSRMHKLLHSSTIFLIIFPLCLFYCGWSGCHDGKRDSSFFNATILMIHACYRGPITQHVPSHAEDRGRATVSGAETACTVPYSHFFVFLLCVRSRAKVLGQLFCVVVLSIYTYTSNIDPEMFLNGPHEIRAAVPGGRRDIEPLSIKL